jgi:hypothetical protein
VAIDGNGNVWIATHAYQPGTNPATYLENEIVELNTSGTVMSGTTGFTPTNTSSAPEDVAIDGSGNVWYLSSNDATLHEMIGAGAPTDVPLAHAVANNKVGARP